MLLVFQALFLFHIFTDVSRRYTAQRTAAFVLAGVAYFSCATPSTLDLLVGWHGDFAHGVLFHADLAGLLVMTSGSHGAQCRNGRGSVERGRSRSPAVGKDVGLQEVAGSQCTAHNGEMAL